MSTIALTRITTIEAASPCDALSREYMDWLVAQLDALYGIVIDEQEVDQIHAALRAEAPSLFVDPGRLYLVTDGEDPVAMGLLKPVSKTEGELKRMFVRPQWQGRGIGRMLFERLLADAQSLGFRRLRLETFPFMEAAVRMYEAHGFGYTEPFEGHEGASHGVAAQQLFMALELWSDDR